MVLGDTFEFALLLTYLTIKRGCSSLDRFNKESFTCCISRALFTQNCRHNIGCEFPLKQINIDSYQSRCLKAWFVVRLGKSLGCSPPFIRWMRTYEYKQVIQALSKELIRSSLNLIIISSLKTINASYLVRERYWEVKEELIPLFKRENLFSA